MEENNDELLDYYIRFIIKNNLEEDFDAFVSKELEGEKK